MSTIFHGNEQDVDIVHYIQLQRTSTEGIGVAPISIIEILKHISSKQIQSVLNRYSTLFVIFGHLCTTLLAGETY